MAGRGALALDGPQVQLHPVRRLPPGCEVGLDRFRTHGQGDAAQGGADRDEGPHSRTTICIGQGCRGELVELKWFDIDLANGRVRSARSFAVTQGEQDTGPTKTRQARDLAFDPVCVEVLRRSGGLHVRSVGSGRMPLVPDPFVLSYNANCEIRVNPDKLTHGFGRGLRASQRDEDLRIGVRSLLAPSPGERG